MKDIYRRFGWVAVYAIAMAYLEAVVVVYIRGLLNLYSYDHVTLGSYESIEMWREAATMVMLLAVGWIAGRGWRDRTAYALFTFGLWDIFYYIWLRILIDWPATLLDWDILFLIPLRWWGPVLAPVLIAALICLTTIWAVLRLERGQPFGFTVRRTLTIAAGGLLALYVFMADAIQALLQNHTNPSLAHPTAFNWPLFLVALALMAVPGLLATRPQRDKHLARNDYANSLPEGAQ